MRFPAVTVAQWRAQVDKELEGQSFEKALVGHTADGIPVEPLYVASTASQSERPPFFDAEPFRLCVQLPRGASSAGMKAELSEGADALWVPQADFLSAQAQTPNPFWVVTVSSPDHLTLPAGDWKGALHLDGEDSERRISLLQKVRKTASSVIPVLVSGVPFHEAGATEAEEIAYVLAAGVRCLEALSQAGEDLSEAAPWIGLQTAVAQNTFIELAKIRALRLCWDKVLRAAGAQKVEPRRTLLHAVCSHRTLTVRDPWVNLLRVTTQMFAAVLGGADLVTPLPFDAAFDEVSSLGRRMARNTGLILREESRLADVMDPAGGAYFFESMTDALARQAWQLFRDLEAQGGLPALVRQGEVHRSLKNRQAERQALVAKRKMPIVGVSEFAHLDEVLPHPLPAMPGVSDGQAFEALRRRAESLKVRPSAVLLTLGAPAESRARSAFAAGFLAAGGIQTQEGAALPKASIVCLCGKDERYAEEGAARAAALKQAGCQTVLIAGRPGPNEPALRAAGVDGFIYLGADVVQTLSWLLDRL